MHGRRAERVPKTLGSQTAAVDGSPAELLREQLLGLTMASEVCARWLDHDSPDLGEVRDLVSEMIVVARRALASIEG